MQNAVPLGTLPGSNQAGDLDFLCIPLNTSWASHITEPITLFLEIVRGCSSVVLPPQLAEADRSCSRIPSANAVSSTQQVL